MRRLSYWLAAIVALAFLGAVVLASLVAVQYWRNDRPIVLPKPRGAHAVGRRIFHWTDVQRSRELMVFVWYPAAEGATGRRARYIPGKWGEMAAEGYLTIPARRMEAIEVSAIDGASLATGRHPLLVLLPAMGLAPPHYTALAEDLASHGYVVAGVTPTGSARHVVFPNGQHVEGKVDPDSANAEIDSAVMQTWCADAAFVVDQVLRAAELQGGVDPARAGVLGHAFGGAVAMQLLKDDGRFKAAANLDGAPWDEHLGVLERPLLVLAGGSDPGLPSAPAGRSVDRLRAVCRASGAGCEMREYERVGYADFSDDVFLPSRFPMPGQLLGHGGVDGLTFHHELVDRMLVFFARM